MVISDPVRLRLALALIILRHKPRNRSCAVYLLDICARFPVQAHASGAAQTQSHIPWREQAHLLEEEVRTLKRKAAMDSAELEAFRAINPTLAQASSINEEPSSSSSKKKKKKTRLESVNKCKGNLSIQTSERLSELQAALSRITSNGDVLPTLNPHNVFDAYQRLLLVSAQDIRSPSFLLVLISSATHLLKGLGELLHSTVSSPKQMLMDSGEIVNTINSILCSVTVLMINSAADNVGATKRPEVARYLNGFLSLLALDVLLPLMKSFAHLSQNTLFSMLQGTKVSKKKSVYPDPLHINLHTFSDVRPALLALFRQVLAKLKDDKTRLLPRAGEILDLVALSAVTEISKLWSINGESRSSLPGTQKCLAGASTNATSIERTVDRPEQDTRFTRDERIYRLARKEALWYLTAIAHDALRSTSGSMREVSPNSTTERIDLLTLAREQIADILSRLLVHCTNEMYHGEEAVLKRNRNHHGHIDDTERGLIMGLVEHAWVVGS